MPGRFRILVADDEDTARESLAQLFTDEGYACQTARDGGKALEHVKAGNFDLVVCDIRMPEMGGFELLEEIKKISPRTSVIMITAYGTIEAAVSAMKNGAYDYIAKPFILDDVLNKVKHLASYRELTFENLMLRKEVEHVYGARKLVGKSAHMQEVLKLIDTVGATKSTVLISGESGTGKELVARALHAKCPGGKTRFVAVNCGAIAESLLESELFGHVKGAFTGADQNKEGLFMAADGGTLFLDEVGDLSSRLQMKLLRALEEKEVLPVGSTQPLRVDARIIAATNRDLEELVKSGVFRQDLYYRLNVVEIRLAPLAERSEDIPPLVRHFISKLNVILNKRFKGITEDALLLLGNYRWKGNIRELENAVERAMILGHGDMIQREDLPPAILGVESPAPRPADLKAATRIFEKEHIMSVLKETDGDKKKTSDKLGIGMSSLYRKLEELGI